MTTKWLGEISVHVNILTIIQDAFMKQVTIKVGVVSSFSRYIYGCGEVLCGSIDVLRV